MCVLNEKSCREQYNCISLKPLLLLCRLITCLFLDIKYIFFLIVLKIQNHTDIVQRHFLLTKRNKWHVICELWKWSVSELLYSCWRFCQLIRLACQRVFFLDTREKEPGLKPQKRWSICGFVNLCVSLLTSLDYFLLVSSGFLPNFTNVHIKTCCKPWSRITENGTHS